MADGLKRAPYSLENLDLLHDPTLQRTGIFRFGTHPFDVANEVFISVAPELRWRAIVSNLILNLVLEHVGFGADVEGLLTNMCGGAVVPPQRVKARHGL
jgi:hypothetical protein